MSTIKKLARKLKKSSSDDDDKFSLPTSYDSHPIDSQEQEEIVRSFENVEARQSRIWRPLIHAPSWIFSPCTQARDLSWFAIGCYYYCIKKYDQSRRFFSKACSMHRTFVAAWIGQGNAFAAKEEGDQAMLSYRTVARLFLGEVDAISKICISTPTEESWVHGIQLARSTNYQFPLEDSSPTGKVRYAGMYFLGFPIYRLENSSHTEDSSPTRKVRYAGMYFLGFPVYRLDNSSHMLQNILILPS